MSPDDFDPPEVDPNDDDNERVPGPPDGFDPGDFLFEQMTDDDWRLLIRDLGRFAASRVRRFRWIAAPDPEDVVLDSIGRLLREPGMWKPHRRRDALDLREALKRFLFQVIWRRLQKLRELKSEDWREDNVDSGGYDRLGKVPKRGRPPEESLDDERRRAKKREMEKLAESRGYGPEFRLRYLEGLKPREIAEVLGVSRKRMYARLQQLRELLRRHFGGDGLVADLFGFT